MQDCRQKCRVKFDHITNDRALKEFCDRAAEASILCFDTEFVSEHSYRPDLCLVQVAVQGTQAILDPRTVDLAPFWQLLVNPGRETVVHAGREEFRFCVQATGKRPYLLFDIQIAAGLLGIEYPAALSTLLSKLLGKNLPKGETRTDWRIRPLSAQQLRYAAQDVVHLEELRNTLHSQLEKLGRLHWLVEEMGRFQDDVEAAEGRQRWRRVSGIAGLSARSLAVVREIWQWRESQAELRDDPPRRVLRDDLLVEMAKRKVTDLTQMKALRGMERGDLRRQLPEIAVAIQRGLDLPESELPRSERRELPAQLTVLGQFLTTAVANLVRAQQLTPSLVCTVQDVRDLIAYRLGFSDPSDAPPLLAQGWRAQVVGTLIDDLLAGRLALRIANPHSEDPLVFERFEPKAK